MPRPRSTQDSTETWTHHRARVANATLRGARDEADLARRDMRAALAADYIRKLVDTALADEMGAAPGMTTVLALAPMVRKFLTPQSV